MHKYWLAERANDSEGQESGKEVAGGSELEPLVQLQSVCQQ
jgi:hypothetical protein